MVKGLVEMGFNNREMILNSKKGIEQFNKKFLITKVPVIAQLVAIKLDKNQVPIIEEEDNLIKIRMLIERDLLYCEEHGDFKSTTPALNAQLSNNDLNVIVLYRDAIVRSFNYKLSKLSAIYREQIGFKRTVDDISARVENSDFVAKSSITTMSFAMNQKGMFKMDLFRFNVDFYGFRCMFDENKGEIEFKLHSLDCITILSEKPGSKCSCSAAAGSCPTMKVKFLVDAREHQATRRFKLKGEFILNQKTNKKHDPLSKRDLNAIYFDENYCTECKIMGHNQLDKYCTHNLLHLTRFVLSLDISPHFFLNKAARELVASSILF